MTSGSPSSSWSPNAVSADIERVRAARSGDVAAFNDLVLEYQDLAYNVASRLVGNGEIAADVTQDSFLSAYRHLDQFKGGSFRSWLLRIVTNASYDVLRSRHQNKQSLDQMIDESGFDVSDPADLPEDLALRQETRVVIEQAIQTLPFEQRSVVVLYDVHQLSYEEVAAALSINLGTVKSRLSRARARLRDYLMANRELWNA